MTRSCLLFTLLRHRRAEGDHIKVTASKYPFPTVCADKASTDWFSSISRTLRWNEREKQKFFVVVEEASEPERSEDRKENAKEDLFDEGRAKTKFEKDAKGDGDLVESDEEEDDDDEIFDIDE